MVELVLFILIGTILGLLLPHLFDLVTIKKEVNIEIFTYSILGFVTVVLLITQNSINFNDYKINLITELLGIILSGFILTRIIFYRERKSKLIESNEIADQILAISQDGDVIIQKFFQYCIDTEEYLSEPNLFYEWKNELLDMQSRLRYYQYVFDNDLIKREVREELRWFDQCLSSLVYDIMYYHNSTTDRDKAYSHRGLYLSFRNINQSIIKLYKLYRRENVYNIHTSSADRIKEFKEVTNEQLTNHHYDPI